MSSNLYVIEAPRSVSRSFKEIARSGHVVGASAMSFTSTAHPRRGRERGTVPQCPSEFTDTVAAIHIAARHAARSFRRRGTGIVPAMRSVLRDPRYRLVLATAGIGLVAIGAVQAMYGPAFPGLMDRFGVGVERVGATVQLHFAAGLVATLASALLLERFGYRRVIALASAMLAVSATTVALAPTWSLLLVGVTGGGLGFGLLNVGLNLVVARTFAPNAAPLLNLVSALFGVGAVLGPLAIGAVAGSLRTPFLGLALVAAATAVLAVRLPDPPRARPAATGRFPWAAGVGFVVLFGLYVAVEQGVASWETVHLEPAVGAQRAAFFTGLFWAALTVGRVAAIALARHAQPRTLVLGASAAGLAALATAHVPGFAPAAYVLAGLAFAPVFPTSLAWIERVFPERSERVVPLALAFANAGPVGATAVIGAWVGRAGPQAVPSALTAIAGVLLLAVAAQWWLTRRA
jgi:fucose permease